MIQINQNYNCGYWDLFYNELMNNITISLKKIFEENNYTVQQSISYNLSGISIESLSILLKDLGVLVGGFTGSSSLRLFIHIENRGVVECRVHERGGITKLECVLLCYPKSVTHIIEKIRSLIGTYLSKLEGCLVDFTFWYFDGTVIESPIITDLIDFGIPDINYPYIPSIKKLLEDYHKSDSNLLLLIGPPGTGKTRFIRNLISEFSLLNKNAPWKIISNNNSPYDEGVTQQHADSQISCYYTCDKHVIETGSIFSSYVKSSDTYLLVLEDTDFHLDSRKNGNVVMYNLLNSSDGLIQCKHKKIILSTNLPSVNDIDEAMIRRGRCFEVLHFRKLTYEESKKFFVSNNASHLTQGLEEKDYSLADLYYMLNNNIHIKKEKK